MLSIFAVLIFTLAVFAYIGRVSMPVPERMPVTHWSLQDLLRNAWRGLGLCSSHTPLGRIFDDPGDHDAAR